MATVTKAREFLAAVPNKVGSLASLLRLLADAKINVVALSGEGKGRKGRIRFVASDAAKAARALKKAGVDVERNDVLLVELSDKPGSGAALAEGLADAGVNIEAGYATASGGKATLVLSAEPLAAASRVIRKL